MAGGNASEGGEFEAEKVGDFLVGNGARRRGRRNGLSKKAKEKKIPQRGLGIAALEKLREEEQQKGMEAFLTFPFFPLIRPPLIPLVPLNPIISSPSSSIASETMEPPSNQSYVGMNLSSRPEKQRLVGIKRPWPTQFPTSREKNFKSASISREEAGFLDGRILSLGLQNQRAEIRVSETGANLEHSTMYNFMGLPDEVMEEQRAALEGGRHVPVPTLLFSDFIQIKMGDALHESNINLKCLKCRKDRNMDL